MRILININTPNMQKIIKGIATEPNLIKSEKLNNDQIISKVVSLVEKKAEELEKIS